MRSVFLFICILMLCPFSRAQLPVYANKLLEYRPAPGQYINDQSAGTPAVALGIINRIGEPLSLGAFGGYVVLGFNPVIANDPGNPYGIDFIIYGNGSATHAEPGIIKVMKDENHNGLPDDTWFEIAGSAHFTNDYVKDYSINYLNPKISSAADVPWTDNKGNSGKVFKNSFHTQPYYPLNYLFQGISEDSMSFTGSGLMGKVKMQNGIFVSLPYAFGYADNIPLNNQDFKGMPDNPYTPEYIEGDGGDAIDISWAVDEKGTYIDLPEIDFVMIYTGINESAGWLGEISTEIRGIVDVAPDKDITGPVKMILPVEIPPKITLFDSLNLSCRVLCFGRPAPDENVLWESMNPEVILITGNLPEIKAQGEAEIKCSLISDPTVFIYRKISVVVPESLSLKEKTGILQEGEKLDINYTLFDNSGEALGGLIPQIIIENADIAEVIYISDNRCTITAKSPGSSLIRIGFPNYPRLSSTYELRVIRKIDPIRVNFSLSNEEKCILPVQNYSVEKEDILSFINRYQKDFNPDKEYITLADAIVSVLVSEGFGNNGKSFAFRQDEYGGDGLYVWQVGFNWEYLYGWGGSKKESTYAKTWVAVVNDQVFASGFDTIEVFENDRISLHHIDDNTRQWSFIRVVPGKDKTVIGETVGFHSEQLDIYPSDVEDFEVSGPFPVVNEPVIVESSVVNYPFEPVTSYTGDFNLSFTRGGKHEVSVGNSEPVVIEVMFPLSIQKHNQFSFYPNPCNDKLTLVNLPGDAVEIRIFSTGGNLKFISGIKRNISSVDLNLSSLEKGVYIIEIISKGKSIKQKLCKI
jgi:hypothetical protein